MPAVKHSSSKGASADDLHNLADYLLILLDDPKSKEDFKISAHLPFYEQYVTTAGKTRLCCFATPSKRRLNRKSPFERTRIISRLAWTAWNENAVSPCVDIKAAATRLRLIHKVASEQLVGAQPDDEVRVRWHLVEEKSRQWWSCVGPTSLEEAEAMVEGLTVSDNRPTRADMHALGAEMFEIDLE